jgi:hypothetical protein
MTNHTGLPSTEAVEKATRLAEQPLSAEEYRHRASIPIGDAEREEILSLIRWFRRRYPTALDRLAYVRRAYARWTGATHR